METVHGTIIRIMFSSEDTGYKVLRVRMKNDRVLVVTGEFGPEIIPETVADFHGDHRSHPKYGPNFRAYSYHIVHNAEELGSIKLFIDNIAPNFGSERSEAVISHFGKDIIDILDNNPERLVEVTGIGKVLATTLQEAWDENRDKWNLERSIYSLRSFLHSLGIKERRVKKILAHFGGQGLLAEQKIRDNPYLLSEIEGFGFTTADYVARNLGIPEDDPRRLKFFVLHLLKVVCPSNGHLYLSANDLPNVVNTYCRENGTKFLGKDRVKGEDLELAIKELIEEERVVIDENLLYCPKQFKYESDSARLLANIVKEPSDLIFLNADSVGEHITLFERESGLTLSDEQRKALYYFAEEKVFIITGAPGTGKTLTLRAIVDLAIRMGFRLTCLAPTGVSAKKLSSVIAFAAYTIHRRLGFRGDHWTYNSLEPYDTDIVIVDEFSMVDMEVFYRLLSALKKRTHLIFVGDKDQLPSVGAGNVLKELIKSDSVPTIHLDQIFRQDEASDVIKAAHKINHGDTDLILFKPDPKADIFFMREQSPERIEEIIIALAQKFKDERRLFQVITPRRTGPLGAAVLNEVLQKALNPPAPHLKEMNCKDFVLRVGDRAIVVKNDYENDVYNGDVGKVINIYSGKVCIKIDDRLIEFTVEDMGEKIRLGYSLTVHKVQGSEYPYIILPFINQFGKNMLQRNLLYTALTRAKQKVIVLGHGSALERAINNASVSKRNTKLGERLTQCLLRERKASLPTSPSEPPSSAPVKEKKELSWSEVVKYFPTVFAES